MNIIKKTKKVSLFVVFIMLFCFVTSCGDKTKDLTDLKNSKKYEISNLILDYNPDDYSSDAWDELNAIISSALTEVDGLSSEESINHYSINYVKELLANVKLKQNENIEEKGMLNRLNPSYYQSGVPIIDGGHVVYINLDGFGYYYFEEARNRNLVPNLEKFMEEGITFNNLRNTLPSITNPCQNQILSGSTSSVTNNVYRYYDKRSNTVIQQQRENASDTIISKAVSQGISVVDIAHYLGEPYLSPSNPKKLYVNPDTSDPNISKYGGSGAYYSRLLQFKKLVNGETINNLTYKIKLEELPQLTVIYCDDLDALGHNESEVYGIPVATSESERMNHVINRLHEIDTMLGEIISDAKMRGVYDELTFFITTDHGMTPFGYESEDDHSDSGTSKLGNLKQFFKNYNRNYNLELVASGKNPSSQTTIVGVGANLNIQLTFKKGITDAELATIKEALLKEPYVGHVLTRSELKEIGYWEGANVDMVISPKGRYCFSNNVFGQYYVRGQHDSLEESSNHVFGVIFGKGIKKNFVYEKEAYNFDFGMTIAAALGIELPKANGNVLDVFDLENIN